MRPAPWHLEDGETLLEILIAVAIMGIATAAILGLFQGTIAASTIHKQQSVAGSLLDNFAEYMQDQGTAPYTDCPAGAATAAYTADMNTFVGLTQTSTSSVFEPEASKYQLTVTVSAGQIGAPGSNPSVTYGSCSAPDQGVQRLTLTVSSTDSRVSESVQVVKWRR